MKNPRIRLEIGWRYSARAYSTFWTKIKDSLHCVFPPPRIFASCVLSKSTCIDACDRLRTGSHICVHPFLCFYIVFSSLPNTLSLPYSLVSLCSQRSRSNSSFLSIFICFYILTVQYVPHSYIFISPLLNLILISLHFLN